MWISNWPSTVYSKNKLFPLHCSITSVITNECVAMFLDSMLFQHSSYPSLNQYHNVLLTVTLKEVLISGSVSAPTWLFSRLSWPFWAFLYFHTHFRTHLSISTKNNLLGFLTGIIYINSGQVTSLQYWGFQFMNILYLSI